MSLPYALILNGVVDNIAEWDGVTPWSPTSANGSQYDVPAVALAANDGTPVSDANGNPVQIGASYTPPGGKQGSMFGVFTNPPPPPPVVPGAPVITSPLDENSLTFIVNEPFLYQITATNSPTSYGATGLPAGLNVDFNTGIIIGTPTQLGTSPVVLSATNAGGTGTAQATLTVSTSVPTAASVQAGPAGQAKPS